MKECPRCHCRDETYFYSEQGRTYCRRCLPFGKVYLDDVWPVVLPRSYTQKVFYTLDYTLTLQQQMISSSILESVKNNHHVSILAVCGAGKTELVYESLCYVLNQGKRVCFALPRRELAKEIYERLSHQFKNVTFSLVYGGHTQDTEGQFVVATTHQLFRFHGCFQLIVVDEIDAFPFKGNDVLNHLMEQSCSGTRIMMSATLDPNEKVEGDFYILNRRYHTYGLPEPHFYIYPSWLLYILLLRKIQEFKKRHLPLLIFVPTFKDIRILSLVLSFFPYHFEKATSRTKHVQQKIQDLKDGKLDFIVTTSILERGVTIAKVQVIVLKSHHALYDEETLIQIAGRVGRHKDAPTGEVLFLGQRKTEAMKHCLQRIRYLNQKSV